MAEKAAQNKQVIEKRQPAEKQPSDQPGDLQLNPTFSMLQQLQKTCGNRAVQRLIQHETLKQPTSFQVSSVIQLLRSGALGGIHYDENPRDMIAIRMSYQVESFEAILTGVNRVVGVFGSSGRTYTDDEAFQSDLREYLASINHPAARGGGPGLSRERWLRFRVRLVRGEGSRLENIEFLEPFESVTMGEPEIEVAEPEGEAAPVETPAAETAAPTTTRGREPAPEEAAPAAEEGWSVSGIAGRIASGAEWLGNLSSGRWVWDPISSQMGEWEAELDRIGERGEGGAVGQVLLVPVTLLFTILGAITSMLDLLARLNPTNLVLQGTATGIRAATGEYTAEEFRRDAEEVGLEAFDIITLGLRNAYHHMEEGIREANVFRITQATGEIILAALALIGIVRGVRGRLAARRAAGSAEGGAAEAGGPAEAGEAGRATTAEAAAPAETSAPGETPGRTSTTAPETPRPSSAPAEGSFSPEFQRWMREAETRAGATFEEARAEWVTRMDREMGAGESRPGRSPFDSPPHQVGEIVPDAQARQMIRQWAEGQLDRPAHQYLSHEQYVYEYREGGGWGRPPTGYIDSQGVFRFDHPESLGMPEIFHIRDQTQVRSAGGQPPPETPYNPEPWMEHLRQQLADRPGQPQGAQPAASARPAGEQQAGARPAEPVDVNAATGEQAAVRPAEPVDVNAATGEQAAVRPAEPVDVNAPTGEQAAVRPAEPARPAESARPVEEPAEAPAAAPGIERVFMADDIAGARQILAAAEQQQLPRLPQSPRNMQQRWNRMGHEGEAPVAFLQSNGLFVYNSQALAQSAP